MGSPKSEHEKMTTSASLIKYFYKKYSPVLSKILSIYPKNNKDYDKSGPR